MMTLSPHVYYDIHIVIYANSGVGYQLVCNLLVLQGNYYDLQKVSHYRIINKLY